MRSFPAAAGMALHVRMLLGMLAVATAALTAVTTAMAAAPPGRAYERVSPADKGGGDVVVGWRAANGVAAYSGLAAFAGTPGIALISQYVARRGATDWTTEPYHPMPLGPGGFNSIFLPTTMTGDMTRMVGSSPAAFNADDADNGSIDIWQVGPNVSVELLSQGPVDPVPDDRPGEAVATGMSADGSHLVFESPLEMAPGGTAGNEQVYDRTGGQTVLVGIDEAGVPLPAAETGGGRAFSGATGDFHEPSAVSRDGSRIFFATPPPRALFVRENGTTSTEYSASQRTGSVGTPATDADFQMATPDGASVFFISPDLLTDDATPGGGLYRYDLGSDDLTFLSTGSTDPLGAQVQGVVQVSEDGERAYFVAHDALGGEGVAGQPNLYLAEDSGLTFIGTLSPSDAGVWSGQGEGYRLADVTPDGSRLVFTSEAQLGTVPHPGVQEVYLYDAEAGETTCISCPPGPPTSSASLDELGNALFFNSIPGGISADGQTILFQAADRLVPNDSNSAPDAYIWEGGSVHLLASGASTAPTIIGGMSEDGTDVYFLTRESLVPVDQDEGQFDIYDARRGGGLPAQQHVPADACEGDACRSGPPPARFDPPATIGFSGPGNVDENPPAAFAVRAISRAARQRFARTGRLTLRVRVSEAGRVAARATSGGETVASASRRAARAGTVRLALRLSRAARNRLERSGRLRVTLRVTFSGRASVTRFTLRSGGGR
jgi:Tol biopolymer transport system component